MSIRYWPVFFIILFFGCSMSGTGTLYPVNDGAISTGVLRIEYQDNPFAYGGPATIRMPDGEVLSGEYMTADQSVIGFGNIYASVYSGAQSAYGTSFSSVTASPGSSPGIISLFGNRGTSMQCEYFVNRSGGGAGACKSSRGALYRLHF